MFLDREINIFTDRHSYDGTFREFFSRSSHCGRSTTGAFFTGQRLNFSEAPALLTDLDNVPGLDKIRRDVNTSAVDSEVPWLTS